MQNTKIEWADSTVNPTSGCDGCELWNRANGTRICYAGQIHERFRGKPAYPGPFEQVDLQPGRMEKAALWPDLRGKDRPDKPWLNGLPRFIFIGDMGDVLSKAVPFEYLLDEVLGNVTSQTGKRHFWLLLTKQSKRLVAFSEWLNAMSVRWPDNLMPMVSVTSQKTVGRVADLMMVRCRWRGISAEPLFGPVDLRVVPNPTGSGTWDVLDGWKPDVGPEGANTSSVDWVIPGGMSGPQKRFTKIEWLRGLVKECGRSEVSCLVKQLGSKVRLPFDEWNECTEGCSDGRPVSKDGDDEDSIIWQPESKGGDMRWWPKDLRVREMPNVRQEA